MIRSDRLIPRFATVALCLVSMAALHCSPNMLLPIPIEGGDVSGTEIPTLQIVRPDLDLSVSQGQGLVIEWLDTDRDSDASISFSLISEDDSSIVIPLVSGLSENQDGSGDRFTASTTFVPIGTYTLRGQITDGVNQPATTIATNRTSSLGPVMITIVEPGTTVTVNEPPRVFVAEPSFNRSVSQDDILVVDVQPQRIPETLIPAMDTTPFDPDSTTTLYIVLDLDNDPLNDNVVAPDPSRIIAVADPLEIPIGDFEPKTFPVDIDLETIPIRADGQPYYIRATITDGQNQEVHSYAAGTINIVRAATGFVDLGQVGRTISGVTLRGFNPGSRLGTTMCGIEDFDNDGVDDFALAAQFGNPRNFGNIGEAYVIYGQDGLRFGGVVNVNSTARTIPGFIMEAPPMRGARLGISEPTTMGITDISSIPDISGDGRPELLVGLAHAEGQFQGRDDDPDDNPPDADETSMVVIRLQQGPNGREIEVNDDALPTESYFGVEDTIISSADPNQNFRADDLEYVNDGANNQTFTLIKFSDVLQQFPAVDTPDRIAGITGALRLNVLNAGGRGTIHELFEEFDASTVTFNNFIAGGGAPVAGEHYDEEELGNLNPNNVGAVVTIQINQLLQRLLISDLPANELRFIIVPDDGTDDNSRFASSEFGDERQRPRLTVMYERELDGGPTGCYPDDLPNNFSDDGNGNAGANETKFEAGGFAVVINSETRDNSGIINPDRLADTVVSLELVGQRPIILGDDVFSQAEGDEGGRIPGLRFQAGWYDFFDASQLGQPPLNGLFGYNVSWIDDLALDGAPEIIVSAPRNELDHVETLLNFGASSTHFVGRAFTGDIVVFPGTDYDDDFWRDMSGDGGTSCIPTPDDQKDAGCGDPGSCDVQNPRPRCGPVVPVSSFEIFAEDPTDFLAGGTSAGDFNLDSVPDLLCGAKLNDRSAAMEDTGSVYVVYGRSPIGDIELADLNDPLTRPPALRIRGETPGDQIGYRQESVRDVNGDRIDDVLISSPHTDFIVARSECDANVTLDRVLFNGCLGQEAFIDFDDPCKPFDFNNDRFIDALDQDVFDCLEDGGGTDCCPVDNGFVAVVFGGVDRQGDRSISQIGTSDLPGVIFYGTSAGDLAGWDVSSAGDFDRDGFGDLLITAPGETREDANARERLGVTYLVFGGPHLQNQEAPIELSEIGDRIPGIVFLTPYPTGAPDEAPTETVGALGDINNDGFDDIAIGVSRADLVDDTFPQGDGDPNSTGRRPDQGDAYIIYGNNIGR